MSICSLADFMEASPRSVRRLACTATVTGRGPSRGCFSEGADFSWPKLRTTCGHQCGHFMAKSRGLSRGHGQLENPNLMAEHHDLELLVRLGPPPGDDEPDEHGKRSR